VVGLVPPDVVVVGPCVVVAPPGRVVKSVLGRVAVLRVGAVGQAVAATVARGAPYGEGPGTVGR
jgi:hypothetical protein